MGESVSAINGRRLNIPIFAYRKISQAGFTYANKFMLHDALHAGLRTYLGDSSPVGDYQGVGNVHTVTVEVGRVRPSRE